jgi:hypothetical protein
MATQSHPSRSREVSGELAARLAQLEQGRASGRVDPNRLLDYIGEIRQVAGQLDLDPWRIRGRHGVLAASLCFAAWEAVAFALPDLAERLGPGLDLALLLGLLGLVYSGWCFMIYFRLRKASLAWFRGLEETIRKGGAIVDYLNDDRTASTLPG